MGRQDHTIPRSEVPQPPQPPEVERATRLYRYQWFGLSVISLIVLLAMLGVFGESFGEIEAEAGALAVRIEYPTRFRYRQIHQIEVTITNTSDQALDTVTVLFDPEYVLKFSEVTFIPSATRPFDVHLTHLTPGASGRVVVGVRAGRYGRHTGEIVATAGGGDTVRARVATFVYP
ncbi:MAG: hypothetical protein ACT443_10820 [Gemmatimonadota bacterium]